MPETVSDQCGLEVTGRVGDTPIHEGLGEGIDTQTCQSVGTPSIGLDESGAPPLPEGRLICAT
jgi:hypothetical protein